MYTVQEIEKEPLLMEMKAGMKLSLISLFSVQLIFQILTAVYVQIISYFQSTANFNILSPRGLSYFSWDMWLIAILLGFSLAGYSVLKKVKDFPLYLVIVYPVILVTISMIRNVSLIQVVVFSLLACAVVLQINFQRAKQLHLSKF